ncbi:glycosyltransferase family 4 protein [Actinacidiphila guanduensis]|uniref:Glycosyltransferase involved in cell wall bisynthesis n=1 Tax=Actinacidiphila guanduensis TaxID=310781 RepID=A0A1G9XYC7_9ACTN|nr:glycosyltransferase family 4 protein [Actinacidiphila guanduensis]SDN01750.1 Glycosyltransferase involved in cell wall bisynthesis [Actinacidiphila guanduensis]
MPQDQYGEEGLGGVTVLHVAQPVDGGVARVVTDLVRAQVRQGARVVVACPPRGPLGPAAAGCGAEVLPWPARRAPGPTLPYEVRAAARAVRAVRPDLLHLHSAKAGLAGRLAVRGRVPTVFQPHAWSYEAATGPLFRAAVRWERGAARWAHKVLCVSAAERDSGERHGVRAGWAVVPNGVDTVRFRPTSRHRTAIRAALPAIAGDGALTGLDPLGAGAPLVVCVGRLCRQKGQDVLLRAWPQVTARVPAARLALVGDGPDLARLRREAPRGVVFAGPCADTVPWYQAADLVVLPSRWEGMALAPLEAMACARPVVVTDVAGARESIPPDDAENCVVPPDDAGALAAALVHHLADPARRAGTGLRALRYVRAHHDLDATTRAVGALYTALIPRPAREASAR